MIINICGDFTTIGRGLSAIKQGTAFSDDIVNLFKSSGLNIINLESPVVSDLSKAIHKIGPNIYTSEVAIAYLRESGINLVTLANNHFYDYGKHGVEKTINTLKANNIDYVGGGLTNDELSKIYYFETHEKKVAILNFCESEFSVLKDIGSNHIDPIHVYRSIKIAKQNADYCIVICHSGHEGYQLPSPRIKDMFHFFIEIGADVVCNHHQHCFSGWEEYKGGKIFYGLGNFFFDDFRPKRQQSSIWNYGFILSININDNISTDIIPYKQCVDTISTLLLSTYEKKIFSNKFYELSNIISNDKLLEIKFQQYIKKEENNFTTIFSPYSKRISMALCRRKLLPNFLNNKKKLLLYNTIRCESHRDLALNVLKNKY